MSNISPLLLSNTFGEWQITINNMLAENNDASANGVPSTLVRYDANGSLSFNALTVNDFQISTGSVITEVRTNFVQYNDTSICTTKAIYDLLIGSTSVRVPIKAKSLAFPSSVTVNAIATTFNNTSTNSLLTPKAVYDLLIGTTTLNVPLNVDTIQLGNGPVIQNIYTNFNSVNDSSVVTSQAIMNLLTTGATLNLDLASLKINSGTQVNKIATDFSVIDDYTLVTAKAIRNYIGGIDNDILTLEGSSIDLGSAYKVNGFSVDFNTIDFYTLPTTYAVNDFLTSGNYSLDIVANTANVNVLMSSDVHTDNVVASLINLNGYSVNGISSSFATIKDYHLVTANAIYNLLTDGQVSLDVMFNEIHGNTLNLQNYSVNTISNVLNSANINSMTLGTTEGFVDLLTGGNSNVALLDLSANTLTIENANATVNNISTDFTNIDDNTLVTASAIYNLLTDGQVSLATDFDSIELTNGLTVNTIATSISGSSINHYTLGTTQAISDAISSGTGTIKVAQVETNDLLAYQGSYGNLPFGQSTGQGFSILNNVGNIVTPYVYTAAIEAYDRRGELSSSGILLSANAVTTLGNSIPNDSLGLYTDGLLRLHIQNDGTLNAYDNDVITTGNVKSDYVETETLQLLGDSTSTGSIVLNCEINTHGQTIVPQPHAAAVTNVLTLPAGADQELVGTLSTQTLTNKTLGDTLVSGHITPTADLTYDLGSANNRFRDLYLSSSSIWMGDLIKIETSSDEFKIKKRDVSALPAILNVLGGDSANAISHVNTTFSYSPAKTTISELTTNDLLSYLQTFANYEDSTLYDLFPPEGDVFYNDADYSEVISNKIPGTTADVVDDSVNFTGINYSQTNKATITNPTGNINVFVNNIVDAEGMCLDVTLHVLQNTVAVDIATLTVNGNNAVQLTTTGNTSNNSLNTFDIKAVYLNSNWYANVLVR